jgi:hypothetical protein
MPKDMNNASAAPHFRLLDDREHRFSNVGIVERRT